MRNFFTRGFLLLLMVIAALSVSDTARSAASYSKTVRLIAGKADTVELNGPVADVLVANPAIADVGTLRANRLYIVGKTVGDTNVLAYDDKGNQLGNIIVQVRMDDRSLQDSLREFFPDEKISVRTVKSNIVLSGRVSSPAVANQVRDLASRFLTDKTQTLVDLMKVDGEQQVMLKVRVVEADRNVLRELGVRTNYRTLAQTSSAQTSYVPGAGGLPIGTGDINGGTLFTNDVGRVATLPFGSATITMGALSTTLNALEQKGIVNTLAEPNLTAISGETAGFLAGGEFPIPTSRDTSGNVTIEFKQFGVSLNFTPSVLNKERIALHLSAEVSAQDASAGLQQQGLTIPGLSVRRAETTVELGSGNTLMIAGLIDATTIHSMNGYPGIQDLPILGALFKSKSFQRNESELLFIVTPYLVKSYAEADAIAEEPMPSKLPGTTVPKLAATVPERAEHVIPATSASVPQGKPQGAAAGNAVSPLSQNFVNNLRKVYGSKALENIGTGAGFGYIIE